MIDQNLFLNSIFRTKKGLADIHGTRLVGCNKTFTIFKTEDEEKITKMERFNDWHRGINNWFEP